MKNFKIPIKIPKALKNTIKTIKNIPSGILLVAFIYLAVGAGAYYTYHIGLIDKLIQETIEEEDPYQPRVTPIIPENPDVVGSPSYPEEGETVSKASVNDSSTESQISEVVSAAELEPIEIEFTPPALGTIKRGYGFSYSEIYNDYRYHDDLEIKLFQGAPVQAVADGKVVTINQSEHYSITIDHGGKLKSYYGNLAEVQVTKGSEIKKGQQLGTIAEDYFTFKITNKGNSENPGSYIPELQ